MLRVGILNSVNFRGVPNSVFRLFGRIRIALVAVHFDAAPAVLTFTTSLNSCGCLYAWCLLSTVVVYDLADALPRDITVHSMHTALLLSLQITKKSKQRPFLHFTQYSIYSLCAKCT